MDTGRERYAVRPAGTRRVKTRRRRIAPGPATAAAVPAPHTQIGGHQGPPVKRYRGGDLGRAIGYALLRSDDCAYWPEVEPTLTAFLLKPGAGSHPASTRSALSPSGPRSYLKKSLWLPASSRKDQAAIAVKAHRRATDSVLRHRARPHARSEPTPAFRRTPSARVAGARHSPGRRSDPFHRSPAPRTTATRITRDGPSSRRPGGSSSS